MWEANAFDGKDDNYINNLKGGNSETGSFTPYFWLEDGKASVAGESVENYLSTDIKQLWTPIHWLKLNHKL